MNKTLEKFAWYVNFGFTFVFTMLVVLPLVISSLILIILSPLLAFFGANCCKLEYTTPESWWKLYKRNIIMLCTDELPIVRWYKG